MAAQRNSKILGIFVRLNERDGKPAYLKHLPRIRTIWSGHWRIRRWPNCGTSMCATD